MARPVRHNAEFFYHPASLRNDRRVKAIRARLGLAGYGLLLMLLEVLTDADHTELETDEIELELLAGDLGVSVTEIDSLLQLAEKVGLFARNAAGRLHCPQLDEWLAPVFEKRNRTRNNPKLPTSGVPVTETPITVAEIHTVEESTVKNSKEDSSESSSAHTTGVRGEGTQKKIEGSSPTAILTIAAHTEGGAAQQSSASRQLAAELASYWHISEVKNPQAWFQICRFTWHFAQAGRLEELREIFAGYCRFRLLRGIGPHSLDNWLGGEGQDYRGGQWAKCNWPAKAEEEANRQLSTGEKAKPSQVAQKMSAADQALANRRARQESQQPAAA